MLQPASKYEMYISMVWNNEDNNRYLKKNYSANIERFTKSKQWLIRQSEEVEIVFKIIFGEPYLRFKMER